MAAQSGVYTIRTRNGDFDFRQNGGKSEERKEAYRVKSADVRQGSVQFIQGRIWSGKRPYTGRLKSALRVSSRVADVSGIFAVPEDGIHQVHAQNSLESSFADTEIDFDARVPPQEKWEESQAEVYEIGRGCMGNFVKYCCLGIFWLLCFSTFGATVVVGLWRNGLCDAKPSLPIILIGALAKK